MAGRRHHILPRFLLRGFTSGGASERVWVYRQASEPFQNSIENVAVERDYYGKADEGEHFADDIITAKESEFAKLLTSLRKLADGEKCGDSLIGEFVAHLAVRTRNLRKGFYQSAETFFDQLFAKLKEQGIMDRLVIDNLRRDPSILEEVWSRRTGQNSMPSEVKDAVLASFSQLIAQSGFPMAELIRELERQFRPQLPEMVRQGQNKALAQGVVPIPRATEYQALHWRVHHPQSFTIVLGDCGVLFEVDGPRRFKPISEKGDSITRVYLPISANCLIVGSVEGESGDMVVGDLNKELARASCEFFVSKDNRPEVAALRQVIGNNAFLIESATIVQIAVDTITSQLGTGS